VKGVNQTDSRAHGKARVRLGMRAKLIIVSLLIVFIPLIVVWGIGIYEDISRDVIANQVRDIGAKLKKQLDRRRQQGDDAFAKAAPQKWLRVFAKRQHVLVRLIDRRGRVVFQSDPIFADRWTNGKQRGVLRRVGDFFFGPKGPPDLVAYETALGPLADRAEVKKALAGQTADHWRQTDDNRLIVFYRAIADRHGVIYLTRNSRRNIRALYELRYQLLKLTLFLAFVAAAMGLWMGWRVVRPLVRLQKTIRSYLQNPAELDANELIVRRGDEIGDLSRDLQTLIMAMQRQISQTAEIAAELAHDLKNPIATISATSELLQNSKAIDADRQRRLSDATRDASLHMNRSVEGLLALARLDQSLASARREPVDLSALLETIVESYRKDPAADHIALEATIDPGLKLSGIASQLEQLVRNLVDNAIIFCDKTIVLRLRRAPDDERIELTVTDDGPGISAGNRSKLFRRFFTARPEGYPAGTGLGLAIAKTIAIAHGGDLDIGDQDNESRTLRGAHFVARFSTLS
jgi:two-component system sensor histidine kinase ChvG